MTMRCLWTALAVAALILDGGCTGVGPFDPDGGDGASLLPANPVLGAIGETVRLQLSLDGSDDPVDGQAVDWSSSNPSVAAVDGSGVVRAVGDGSATITGNWNGIESSTAVTVDATIVYSIRISASNPPDADASNSTAAAQVTVMAN